MNIIKKIIDIANKKPNNPAIIELDDDYNEKTIISYSKLLNMSMNLSDSVLKEIRTDEAVGIVMGNTCSWIIADLALMNKSIIEVPVPLSFSAEQAYNLLKKCSLILVDQLGLKTFKRWKNSDFNFPSKQFIVNPNKLSTLMYDTYQYPKPNKDSIIKIIHTSGTTSSPKGVLIRSSGLNDLVDSLVKRTYPGDYSRYLNLVPLSLLIEQVTAIYMPLTTGGTIIQPPISMPPLGDPSVIASERMELIEKSKPSALTLSPALVEAIAEKAGLYNNLKERIYSIFGRREQPLLAAGGAPIPIELLNRLKSLGIHVYQGYGLSENSSVVSWNYRDGNKLGTVGKPLSHVRIKIIDDGELCIKSTSLFAGYSNTNDPSCCNLDDNGWLHTGDIATVDTEGYISIVGRKKLMIIMSNGRNVSPEWLESRYRTITGISDVIIFGDGKEFLQGIFIYEKPFQLNTLKKSIIQYAKKNLNQIEYIPNPILLKRTNNLIAELFTVTGRPRREYAINFIKKKELQNEC